MWGDSSVLGTQDYEFDRDKCLMKISKNKSQFILVFAIAQTIGLAVSAMIALFGTVEKQSVEHQKALSPIFEFVIDEIIQPLYFVAGIAERSNLYDLMNYKD